MQTSRPQPAMLEGLSRFLIEHERCGAGFDVAHPAGVGSGRVSITCRGCGARHEYLTSTLEIEREVQFQVQPAEQALTGAAPVPPPPQIPVAPPPDTADTAGTTRQPAFTPGVPAGPPPPAATPSPPSPGPSAPAADKPPPPPKDKPPSASKDKPPPPKDKKPAAAGRGITGARAGTLALLAVAAIAVVVALLRLSGGSNDDNAANSAAPGGGPATTAPQQPAQPQQPQQPAQPSQPNQPADLRVVTTPTYTLSVPADWTVNSGGPALRVAPPDSDAVVLRVYSDKRPDLSLSDMGRLSGQLLLGDHPGASLSPVHGTKVGGIDAATVGVDFDGGSETAFAIARGDDRYLLLVAVSSSASATERRQMAAVVSSFKPA